MEKRATTLVQPSGNFSVGSLSAGQEPQSGTYPQRILTARVKAFALALRRHANLTLGSAIVLLLLSVIFSDPSSDGINPPTSFGGKVKLHAQEFLRLHDYETRLRRYEQQLRQRASYLDTLLQDAETLDSSDQSEGLFQDEKLPKGVSRHLGMGGGDANAIPYFHFGRSTNLEKTDNLLRILDKQITQLKIVPLGAPVDGQYSSGFGYRASPFTGRRDFHSGLDISVERMSPVVATADGMVEFAGYYGGYGKAVIINHGENVRTLYGHLSDISVAEGSRICRGQQLGFVGSTGNSTGPHLHYEVRVNGIARDPKKYIELASFLKLFQEKNLE